MTNGFYFFITFFLVFFNQLSKFFFLCQAILFFTSNECFSHSNVQQLSTLKHKSFCFVFTSSFKNNIENENVIITKNLFNFIEFRILRYVLHCSIFLERDLKIQKLISRGVLIAARGKGESDFFKKRNKRRGDVYSGP